MKKKINNKYVYIKYCDVNAETTISLRKDHDCRNQNVKEVKDNAFCEAFNKLVDI